MGHGRQKEGCWVSEECKIWDSSEKVAESCHGKVEEGLLGHSQEHGR